MKPRPSAASGADHQMVMSLDLAMSMSLPPSNLLGISGSTPDPASGIISSDFLMDMTNDLKDLKELETFYTERASK